MVFSSPLFLFIFLPITLLGYLLIGKRFKNFFLMLMSLVFYSWGGAQYLILMCFSIIVNYLLGIWIEEKSNHQTTRKIALAIGVIFNLGILGYYKYFNFFLENVLNLCSFLKVEINLTINPIILPIGISFFTFQILSYVIDVYRGQVKAQRNLSNLTLYIMLFPQLIAGPIVRYIDVEKQIRDRQVTLAKFRAGIERFIIGFSKKVILSNSVGYIADYVFNEPRYYDNMIMAWVGIVCYALQIYHDFSGYSDMAIGLGKMFGFDFLENFNYPYISKSIKEFWRRWHISLSGWFRDYIYIPLGGSRKGKAKTYRNLMIVFFVTGLWHGASWNFIIWGLFYGVFLIVERGKFGEFINKMPSLIQRGYSLVVILVGWVFFRAENLSMALAYIKGMFSFRLSGWTRILEVMDRQSIAMIILAMLFSIPVVPWVRGKIVQIGHQNETLGTVLEVGFDIINMGIFIVACSFMVGASFNPFIYFRF